MLTIREKEILAIVHRLTGERGFPPTLREIGAAAGIKSTNGVRYFLDRLEAKGCLRRNQGLSRGIEMAHAPTAPARPALLARDAAAPAAVRIPIVGRVAAGHPVLSEENFEDTLLLDPAFAGAGRLFALKVRGDSMKDAGILEGDTVVVREQREARSGEIVVALVDGEATVKTYRVRRSGGVVLEPANPAFEPIEISERKPLSVLGKVVSVMRRVSG